VHVQRMHCEVDGQHKRNGLVEGGGTHLDLGVCVCVVVRRGERVSDGGSGLGSGSFKLANSTTESSNVFIVSSPQFAGGDIDDIHAVQGCERPKGETRQIRNCFLVRCARID
jgi:hypothetical protein